MDHRAWQRFLLLFLCSVFGAFLIAESFLTSSRWIDRPFPGFFVHENLTIGPYFVPGWSGASAGLQSLDRIARMNGVKLITAPNSTNGRGKRRPAVLFVTK